MYGNKSGAHGHFGFTEAHVTAHQTIHRFWREHVGAHGFDGGLLVGGFFKREACAECCVIGFRVIKGMTFAGSTPSINVEQLGGDIAHLFGRLTLSFLPRL